MVDFLERIKQKTRKLAAEDRKAIAQIDEQKTKQLLTLSQRMQHKMQQIRTKDEIIERATNETVIDQKEDEKYKLEQEINDLKKMSSQLKLSHQKIIDGYKINICGFDE